MANTSPIAPLRTLLIVSRTPGRTPANPETKESFFLACGAAASWHIFHAGHINAVRFSQKTCLPAAIAPLRISGMKCELGAMRTTSTPLAAVAASVEPGENSDPPRTFACSGLDWAACHGRPATVPERGPPRLLSERPVPQLWRLRRLRCRVRHSPPANAESPGLPQHARSLRDQLCRPLWRWP